MSTKALCRVLQVFIVVLTLLGGVVFGVMAPSMIQFYAQQFPEFAHIAKPFSVITVAGYLLIAAGMMVLILMLNSVAKGLLFSDKNAKCMGIIGYLALAAVVYYSIEFALLLVLAAANPGVLILYIVGFFAGVVLAAAAFLIRRIIMENRPATA